jgi:hypothetical protein
LLVKRGLFRGIWMMALEEYDDLHGLDWEWQSMDGAMTKAPLGGEKNRAKPHGSSETRNEAELVDRRTRPADWARRLRSQHAR